MGCNRLRNLNCFIPPHFFRREKYYRASRMRLLPDAIYSLIFHSAYSPTRSFARSFVRSFVPVYLLAGLSRPLPVEPSWALHLHIGTVSRSGESRVRLYRTARSFELARRGKRRNIRVHVNVKRGRMGRRASLLWGWPRGDRSHGSIFLPLTRFTFPTSVSHFRRPHIYLRTQLAAYKM